MGGRRCSRGEEGLGEGEGATMMGFLMGERNKPQRERPRPDLEAEPLRTALAVLAEVKAHSQVYTRIARTSMMALYSRSSPVLYWPAQTTGPCARKRDIRQRVLTELHRAQPFHP